MPHLFTRHNRSMPSSQEIRREKRRCRREIPPRLRHLHSLAAARHFVNSPLFRQSRRIAIYLAADGEIDPAPLAVRAAVAGKDVFLPVLRPMLKRSLWFAEHRNDEPLRVNRFGIGEPDIRKRKAVPPWSIDLILLPLTAFDDRGNRLGMGGGFYDRTLAYLQSRTCWFKPRLIGLAHSCQQADHLHSEPWDIPLQGIITEQGFREFRTKSKQNSLPETRDR